MAKMSSIDDECKVDMRYRVWWAVVFTLLGFLLGLTAGYAWGGKHQEGNKAQ